MSAADRKGGSLIPGCGIVNLADFEAEFGNNLAS
jgi:hypothetical protein